MKIQESAEMYMEAILVLQENQKTVRSIDIVNYLGYSKPSVSRAMKSLKEEKLITIDEHGFIQLTQQGARLANHIYENHKVLTAVFLKLGVSLETAKEDACRIEHVISDESFKKIKDFLQQ